jgi:hypothetical protein
MILVRNDHPYLRVGRHICVPSPPLVGATVVVVGPTEMQILLLPSQEPVVRLSYAQVIMILCISYATCHGKVDKSFLARPPVLAALELGPTQLPCSTSSEGLRRGHQPQIVKKVMRQRLARHRSCSRCPLHGGASSPTFPGRCFGMPGRSL